MLTDATREAARQCARNCSRSQVEAEAKACETAGCPSHIHCFVAPIASNQPICAKDVLRQMDEDLATAIAKTTRDSFDSKDFPYISLKRKICKMLDVPWGPTDEQLLEQLDARLNPQDGE